MKGVIIGAAFGLCLVVACNGQTELAVTESEAIAEPTAAADLGFDRLNVRPRALRGVP